MSFKIPCGGFKLDEKSFSLDENGVLSIPKPLTYDYMPEGYPSKSMGLVTLMKEQKVTFSESGSNMRAQTPTLDIKLGDKLTIIWDGVSYNATVKRVNDGHSEVLAFGNLGLVNLGDAEDYPFVCGMLGSSMWTTTDTATSHTIKVMRQQVKYTPIDVNYMPEGYPSKGVETVTLMKEQKVTFSESGSNMRAQTPTLDIKLGDKLTIIWDGVSYNATVKRVNDVHSEVLAFGNLGLVNLGDAEDYPFVCGMLGSSMVWTTADTATTHTIKVMRQQVTITPMSADFMPVVDGVIISSSTASSTKKFKITVDDSGTLSATEVT